MGFSQKMSEMEEASAVAQRQASEAEQLVKRNITTSSLQSQHARKSSALNSNMVNELLKVLRANDEQKEFWQVWAKYIHDKATDDNPGQFQRVIVNVNLRWMQIELSASKPYVVDLLRSFLERLGCLGKTGEGTVPGKDAEAGSRSASWKRSFDEMTMVLDQLEAEAKVKDKKDLEVKVWCRFKHMRLNHPRPGIDFGFMVRQSNFQWSLLDVLLHPSEDQEVLRSFCAEHAREAKEGYCPQWYGSTLLPDNPERQLCFEIKETVATNYKQIILQAFFFFKAMGLMKPEDAIVKALQRAGASSIAVDVHQGPQGLVRINLSLFNMLDRSFNRAEDVTPMMIIEELVKDLDVQYSKPEITQIQEILGGMPDIIDYVAETTGYSLRMGFTYPLV
jgi:hypothetical protein